MAGTIEIIVHVEFHLSHGQGMANSSCSVESVRHNGTGYAQASWRCVSNPASQKTDGVKPSSKGLDRRR